MLYEVITLKHGPDSENDFLRLKWFCDIVVGSVTEAAKPVFFAALRGKHYNRYIGFFPDYPAEFISVNSGKH